MPHPDGVLGGALANLRRTLAEQIPTANQSHLGVVWPVQLIEAVAGHGDLSLAKHNIAAGIDLNDLVVKLVADECIPVAKRTAQVGRG